MKNSLFKKIAIKILRFSFKVILIILFDTQRDKRAQAEEEWSDDYDEYYRAVTKRNVW